MTAFNQHTIHSVVYGNKTIGFKLIRCQRKTMEIAVHPDGTVNVKVPIGSEYELIEKKVSNKARWIIKQQNYFKQFSPKTPKRSYINGETHLYLGKQYRLKVEVGPKNSVKLTRGYFHVTCREETTPNTVKKLLNEWYVEKAQLQFTASMDRCWHKFNWPDMAQPKLSIKRMQKRWGSISKKGHITINTQLIIASKECIDYVVMHELCHLKYHNHSAEFYKLLGSVNHNWKKIKHKLELSTV